MDGAELCLHGLELLGEKLIDDLRRGSVAFSLSDDIEKKFGPDVNGPPNFRNKRLRLHWCGLWGNANDRLGAAGLALPKVPRLRRLPGRLTLLAPLPLGQSG